MPKTNKHRHQKYYSDKFINTSKFKPSSNPSKISNIKDDLIEIIYHNKEHIIKQTLDEHQCFLCKEECNMASQICGRCMRNNNF